MEDCGNEKSIIESYPGIEASIVKLDHPVRNKVPNLKYYDDMAMITPLNKEDNPDQGSEPIMISSPDSEPECETLTKRDILGCVNCSCTSGITDQFFEADASILNYYKIKQKKKYRRFVCSKCRDTVENKIASLVLDLQSDKPLLEMKFDRIEEIIELSDSDDSDSENGPQSTESSAGMKDDVNKDDQTSDDSNSGESIENIIEEVWKKFNIDDKIETANKELESKLGTLNDNTNEITGIMKDSQKLLDEITCKLYKQFQNTTPSINDYSERPPKKENETEMEKFVRLSLPSLDKSAMIAKVDPANVIPKDIPQYGRYISVPFNIHEIVLVSGGKYDKPWQEGKVISVYNKGTSQNKSNDHYAYNVAIILNQVQTTLRVVTGLQLAYPRAPRIRHIVGSRVLAETSTIDYGRDLYSGTVIEIPCPMNHNRYLVLFDIGHAEYYKNHNLRTIAEVNETPWEDCPKWIEAFMKEYVDNYPMRTMLTLSLGQTVIREGFSDEQKSENFRVMFIDVSIVKLKCMNKNNTIWMYRGSPCLKVISKVRYSKIGDKIPKVSSGPAQSPTPKLPVPVLYLRNQTNQLQSTIRNTIRPPMNASPHLRSLRPIRPAPFLSSQHPKGVRTTQHRIPVVGPRAMSPKSTNLNIPIHVPNNVRRSSAMVNQMLQGPAYRVTKRFLPGQRGPVPQPRLVPQNMPGQRAFMQNMLNKQRPECKLLPHQTEQMPEHSKVMFFTPKSFVKTLNYENHECSRSCCREIGVDLRNYNPLTKPFLCGWERRTCKGVINGDVAICVYYRAPCGVRLRNMEELHRYLQIVRSQLGVDYFDFNPSMQCLAEFTLTRCFVSMKDISGGKENVPIPCVNYFDQSFPKMCTYSSVRTPTRGVSLNLDPEFLCGCDCVDDCQDRDKCACWQLTLEGARAIGMEGKDVGYQYRRLLQPITTGIYECNSRCSCRKTCLNRVAQFPLQLKLQVYRTVARGWGLRSMNDVPRGSFICIYAGNLLTEASANTDGMVGGDEYLAELDYIEGAERMKEGYEADVEAEKKEKENGNEDDKEDEEDEDEYMSGSSEELDSEDKDDEDFRPDRQLSIINSEMRKRLRKRNEEKARKKLKSSEPPEKTYKSAREYFGEDECCYVMDAKIQGNLGRFLNHSCAPNVFVQNVFVDTHDLRFPWVAFFALADIKAGSELTWNYNYEIGSVPGRIINCKCGAAMCKGRLL